MHMTFNRSTNMAFKKLNDADYKSTLPLDEFDYSFTVTENPNRQFDATLTLQKEDMWHYYFDVWIGAKNVTKKISLGDLIADPYLISNIEFETDWHDIYAGVNVQFVPFVITKIDVSDDMKNTITFTLTDEFWWMMSKQHVDMDFNSEFSLADFNTQILRKRILLDSTANTYLKQRIFQLDSPDTRSWDFDITQGTSKKDAILSMLEVTNKVLYAVSFKKNMIYLKDADTDALDRKQGKVMLDRQQADHLYVDTVSVSADMSNFGVVSQARLVEDGILHVQYLDELSSTYNGTNTDILRQVPFSGYFPEIDYINDDQYRTEKDLEYAQRKSLLTSATYDVTLSPIRLTQEILDNIALLTDYINLRVNNYVQLEVMGKRNLYRITKVENTVKSIPFKNMMEIDFPTIKQITVEQVPDLTLATAQ